GRSARARSRTAGDGAGRRLLRAGPGDWRRTAGHQRAGAPPGGGGRVIARWLAALALLLPAPLLADTLVDNINGISIDRDGKVARFTAMTIDEQGRIVKTYARGEDPPRADFRENGRERTV